MTHKVITSLIPNYQNLKDSKVFLGLALLSVALRFPFFFRDYIDRDESTFILMAQSWVEGHLPYTQLWDLKPPLVFLFFSAIIYFFGKSFIAIRLFGALAVAVISFFTYKAGKEVHSSRTGFWPAIGCVYLLSLFGSVQGVMSEHLSMLLFVPALFFLLKFKKKRGYFLAGIFFGLSLMMKLNLAYALLGVFIWVMTRSQQERRLHLGIERTILMGTGVLLAIVATFLPYLLAGIPEVWVDSVIKAPLAYSTDQQNSVFKVLPLAGVLIVLGIACWKKKWIDFSEPKVQLLAIVIAGVVFSFLKSGKVNGHYLMQLYPMILILLGIALSNALIYRTKYYPIVLLLTILLPVESYLELTNIVKNKKEHGTYYNGEGFTVPEFIREHHLNQEEILFFEYHIGYWLLGSSPPSKAATHPSNICRPALYPFFKNPRKNALEELQFLLDTLRPKTVVTRKDKPVFDKEYVAEDAYVRGYLSEHYRLEGTVGRAEVFSRLEGQ
ncbi:Dolichyl-phosphate-mannose-protein mannosyltransferase [Muriicola jejuensis]|uniref:Glycosyltransferase n=1 Tax=Muriicola jejuensis TaxID=504488 RepID=A0A6P0UEQ5_9FLAO|nr:glycosyltransferase family 39 protein [Muriicola jejuensis]NER10228.1 glycosyltransferase [Muriicola jejuensis]SMP01932.1 Dolichyl-phosphate-mannose-protein mannosyltransferase [Muriicola jejuensis]